MDGTAARRRGSSDGDDTRAILWRFAPMIYGPTLLFGLGEGALLPMLPVLAASRGATTSQAALIASVIVVFRLLGNLPAGHLVGRLGERWTMAIAGAVAAAGGVGILLSRDLVALGVSVAAIGLSASSLGLARHAFMTSRAPLRFRARALSLLGGSYRAGMFAGPFAAAALLAGTGRQESAVWCFLVAMAALVVLVAVGRDPEAQLRSEGRLPRSSAHSNQDDRAGGVFAAMRRNARPLAALGLPAAALSGLRQSRVHLLPLWGVSIGMDAGAIALIVGITGALEFALFYSSGQIMDRWGRLWACLPSMVLMGGAFTVLAFTHDALDARGWFIGIAVVIGIGNGLSSGILMTLGADLAPAGSPAAFLGAWRLLTDGGAAGFPLLIAAVAAAASLPVAAGVVGVLGLAGAAGFAVSIPRWVPHRRPAPPTRQGPHRLR